jgi:CheY-like chemotaxis protein
MPRFLCICSIERRTEQAVQIVKLLIVDDNARMRQMLRLLLARPADEICEASDGVEALAACEQHRPDLVLMDVKMKTMNGLEATARIKAAFPSTRVIMVSEYDDAELRVAAQTAGACGYVAKDNLLPLRQLIAGAVQSREQNINSNSSNQKESLL